jgi:LCP family protein required for cell wall assembly
VEATKQAVEAVTGLKIQSYLMVDMVAFASLVDALGGVTIYVKQRLPIGGQEDALGQPINVNGWIEPGVQHMNGKTALWYARARHGSSDYDRMGRQREVESALLSQLDPANVLARFQKIATAGKRMIHTDIPQGMLGRYVDLAVKAKKKGIDALQLVPPKYDMVNPNFAAIKLAVRKAVRKAS